MQLSSIPYSNDKEFNRFKKCPHCHTIWFRVSGCYNVFCGCRTSLKVQIFGRYKNYVVELKLNNNSLEIRDEEITTEKSTYAQDLNSYIENDNSLSAENKREKENRFINKF